jgi:hypothetical protein
METAMTGLQLTLLTVIMLAAVAVSFWIGLAMRRRSDTDLIRELEAELDARRIVMPPELAHEPVTGGFIRPGSPVRLTLADKPGAYMVSATALLADLDTARSEVADTVWDLPAVQLDGIEDIEVWTATLVASTDRVLARLGIDPGVAE